MRVTWRSAAFLSAGITVAALTASMGASLFVNAVSADAFAVSMRADGELAVRRGSPLPVGVLLSWRDALVGTALVAAVKDYADFDTSVEVDVDGVRRHLKAAIVTAEFFEIVESVPVKGSYPRATAFGVGQSAVVLSEAVWRGQFGASPDVLGRPVVIRGSLWPGGAGTSVVAAVVSEDVEKRYHGGVDLWLIRAWAEIENEDRRSFGYSLVVAPRKSISTQALETRLKSLESQGAEGRRIEPLVTSLRDWFSPLSVDIERLFSYSGWSAAILSLSLCSIAAGLSLGARRREIAIRLALGARPSALIRHFALECLLTIAVGVTTGWLCYAAVIACLKGSLAPLAANMVSAGSQFAFWGASLVGMSLLVMPYSWLCVRSSRWTNIASRRWRPLGAVMASAQFLAASVAAFMVLIALALGFTLHRLAYRPVGFSADGLSAVQLRLADSRQRDPETVTRLYREISAELVKSGSLYQVAGASGLPFLDAPWLWTIDSNPSSGRRAVVNGYQVDENYFDLVKIPVMRGRGISVTDDLGAPAVVVVSETLAAILDRSSDVVGKSIDLFGTRTVVGVVADTLDISFRYRRSATAYVSFRQAPPHRMAFIGQSSVRQDGMRSVQAAVERVDPSLMVSWIPSWSDVVSSATAVEQIASTLSAAMAAISVFMLAASMAAGLSQFVDSHLSVLGTMLAVGASRADIWLFLFTRAMSPVIAGTIVGAVVAFLAAPVLSQIVFETAVLSPASLAILAIAVALVAGALLGVAVVRVTRVPIIRLLEKDS